MYNPNLLIKNMENPSRFDIISDIRGYNPLSSVGSSKTEWMENSLVGDTGQNPVDNNSSLFDLTISNRPKRVDSFHVIRVEYPTPDRYKWKYLWEIRSRTGRISKIIRTLFLKFLWDELSSSEYELFFSIPEVIEDPLIGSALRLRSFLPRKQLRNRINAYLLWKGLPILSRDQYRSSKNLLVTFEKIKVFKRRYPIIEYSGWRRHQNDQGSLSPERESPFDILIMELLSEEDIIFNLLTVCEFPEIPGRTALTIGFEKAETVRFQKFLKQLGETK